MNQFGFEESGVMFGATPVENRFLLEYMPAANGDFVKVYLYGLMQCCYPAEDFDLDRMARELGMTAEDIRTAYRYWERKGMVARVSDEPPVWRYHNLAQRLFTAPAIAVDPEYEAFSEALHAQFGNDRVLKGSEIAEAYEWVEELKLPPEVVLMLVQYKIRTAGRQFTFKSAEKLAAQLRDEGVATAEDAEAVLSRDQALQEGTKQILRRLGKRRSPSQDELQLYRTWTEEWGFDQEAIEAACRETTKGEPTFAYLNGILSGLRERSGSGLKGGDAVEKQLSGEQDRKEPLRRLNNSLRLGIRINAATLDIYEEMRSLYSDEVIAIAAR